MFVRGHWGPVVVLWRHAIDVWLFRSGRGVVLGSRALWPQGLLDRHTALELGSGNHGGWWAFAVSPVSRGDSCGRKMVVALPCDAYKVRSL